MKKLTNWFKKNKLTAIIGALTLAFIGWEYRDTLAAWKEKIMDMFKSTTPTEQDSSNLPRGLRNNNPGNLVQTETEWVGEVRPSKDPLFKQFKSRGYGYRAMFKLLNNYIKDGNNTIRKIVEKWSPADGDGNSEESTEAYVQFVSNKTNIRPDRELTAADKTEIAHIVKAMSHHENGIPAIDNEVEEGYELLQQFPS